jgi:hypothetical protein
MFLLKEKYIYLNDGVRIEGSLHADFPQRGKSAPIRPSLFSPSERNHARSGLIGASSPSILTPSLAVITVLEMLSLKAKDLIYFLSDRNDTRLDFWEY